MGAAPVSVLSLPKLILGPICRGGRGGMPPLARVWGNHLKDILRACRRVVSASLLSLPAHGLA